MKLRYKHQRFQTEAARAVTDAFRGQPYVEPSEFLHDVGKGKINYGELGFANVSLVIDRTQLTENVRAVQLAQGLKPIEHFEGDENDTYLTIEMETGTGKTYTYIKILVSGKTFDEFLAISLPDSRCRKRI